MILYVYTFAILLDYNKSIITQLSLDALCPLSWRRDAVEGLRYSEPYAKGEVSPDPNGLKASSVYLGAEKRGCILLSMFSPNRTRMD
jgi:hypothetical protein